MTAAVIQIAKLAFPMFSIAQVGLTWLRDGKVGDEKVEKNENTLKHFARKLETW